MGTQAQEVGPHMDSSVHSCVNSYVIVGCCLSDSVLEVILRTTGHSGVGNETKWVKRKVKPEDQESESQSIEGKSWMMPWVVVKSIYFAFIDHQFEGNLTQPNYIKDIK